MAIYNCRVYVSVFFGEQHADAINPVYEANSTDTYVWKFAQWWADGSNDSSENSVILQIAVFIYSRTAVFISTFYSRKSELFLKKGGVILSDLATRLHCIISSPGAISDCTARSFTCYCRFCVLQQLISVHFLMLINTSVNAFLRVAA